MRQTLPLGIYHPGTTLLHHIPAGPKLGLLFTYSIFVVALHGPWPPVGALAFSIALGVWARVPLRTLWRGLRPILLVVAVLGAFQLWQHGWPLATEIVATMLALVVAATVFTATTPMDAMLDAITRGLMPFGRIGVNPAKVALTFSLMIGAIPQIFTIAHETREAAKARGLERSARANLTPMVLRVVAQAHDTGDALAARGLGDDN
ncbi:MAG: energy-coupling factor transporter transmembrane protein EcfT [Kineosporiaceae bacterium]|nr:energy-coupling factor transporter transmembrane protein EcfT [Aeromicrobium sp.]